MKVLISGGTGFLGHNLLKKLNKEKVLVLTRKKIGNFKNIEYHKCDLSKPKTYIKKIKKFRPNTLIHLAWEDLPVYDYKTSFKNILLTKNLIEEIRKISSCKKILISGSCFEADNLGGKVNENSDTKNHSFFSISKNFLKSWVFSYFQNTNISVAWIRIFYVYGHGQRPSSLIPLLVKAKKNRKKINILTPNDRCDYIFIDDVVLFLKKLIYSKFNSDTFNLGSGIPIKIIDLSKKILKKDFNKICIYSKKSKVKNNYWADMSNTYNKTRFKTKTTINEGIQKVLKNNND